MASALNEALREVGNYSDPDAFASDMYLSSVWSDKNIPRPPYSWLRQVWEAANRSFPDIVEVSSMNMSEFSEYFIIPYRTVQNWCRGVNTCPIYSRLMIQQILGQFDRTYIPDYECRHESLINEVELAL